jgi:5-methylcytosine-specific restriction enzyme subunit McrC
MKHLTIIECFETIPIINDDANALSSMEADELSKYVKHMGLDEQLIQISRTDISFVNYVGFIQLSSCSIEILPKVTSDDLPQSRRVLLRMLQRTGFLDVHESTLGQLVTEKMNLFEIIAYLFTGKLLKELNKGVQHAYRVQQERLQSVRGRIDMVDQIRHSYTKSTAVSCIYDDFHSDIPLNRLLKTAVRMVLMLSRHMETRKKASQVLLYLDEVNDVSRHHLLKERIFFDRSNKRFQESWRMANLILSQSAPLSASGNTKSSSILFKMNDLFEMYIAYLANRVNNHVTIKDRSRKLLIKDGTEQGTFQLEPDLLIGEKNSQRIIIDTKWKRIKSANSRHGVQREDFYQMYAYLTRYNDVRTVILLYPHHTGITKQSGLCLESWHLEQNMDKKLKVYSINYENELKAIEELSGIING